MKMEVGKFTKMEVGLFLKIGNFKGINGENSELKVKSLDVN